jgi:L-arabinose isomerase
MSEGIGYAGEGDALRAAAMRQLIELTGEANFTEIYTVDFKRDLFFMSHMQECSIGIARKDRKVRLKQMPFWVQGMSDYTGMFFTAEPGDYTLVCITPEPGGRFRMVSFTGNVPDLPVLETYNRAYWLLRPAKPAGEMLDLYSLAGGAHHLSAIPGKRTGELAMLAKMLGFTFVDLDR